MDEKIDIKSLVKVSKFAKLMDKSATWAHRLAEEKKIDMIIIDGVHFIKVNEKFRKYVK